MGNGMNLLFLKDADSSRYVVLRLWFVSPKSWRVLSRPWQEIQDLKGHWQSEDESTHWIASTYCKGGQNWIQWRKKSKISGKWSEVVESTNANYSNSDYTYDQNHESDKDIWKRNLWIGNLVKFNINDRRNNKSFALQINRVNVSKIQLKSQSFLTANTIRHSLKRKILLFK